MVPNLQIRSARLEDAPAIANCVKEAYEHYVERLGKPPGPMLDDYHTVVSEHHAYVMEAEPGRFCGILVLIAQKDRFLLDNIAVATAWQGKGIGKQLLNFAEEEAKRRGWDFIDLYTHELMCENIALYQRIGYVAIERRIEKGYARVYMRKFL